MLNLWVSHDNHLFLKLGVNLSNATMHNIHKGEFLKAVLDFFEDFFLNFSNRNDSYIVMIRYTLVHVAVTILVYLTVVAYRL